MLRNIILKRENILVALLIALAIAVRFYYLAYPLGRSSEITVDEAVYGVQAIRVENGERPVFYPAQDYTGSFSAYLSALVFSIFGVSVLGLKLIPFLFSIGTIWLIYLLALKIFNRRVALFSLLISALGTPFWNNWSSRAGTGYVEATFVGAIILLLVVNLTKGESHRRTRILYFTAIGFLSGLGFWMQPTIVYFIVPSLIYLLINLREKSVIPFVFFCLGFAVGGFPVIYYNLFINLSGTAGALFKKPWGMRGSLFKLILEGFPVLLGGRTSNSTVDFNHLTSILVYGIFVSAFLYFSKVVLSVKILLKPEFLLMLTFISTIGIFITSTPFNQLSIEPRYVFSLYIILPIMIGLFLERVFRFSVPFFLLLLLLYLFNSALGLYKAGPLSFLDPYSFKSLVSFLGKQHLNYIISTPALGHRIMFFSGGLVKAAVHGGGITEARFEKTNQEVIKIRDVDPRLVAYACLKGEPESAIFKTEGSLQFGQSYSEAAVEDYYTVVYSSSSVPKTNLLE